VCRACGAEARCEARLNEIRAVPRHSPASTRKPASNSARGLVVLRLICLVAAALGRCQGSVPRNASLSQSALAEPRGRLWPEGPEQASRSGKDGPS